MVDHVLNRLAEQYHVSKAEIVSEMERSIEEGYRNRTEDWCRIFGDRKPSIEEFLQELVREVSN